MNGSKNLSNGEHKFFVGMKGQCQVSCVKNTWYTLKIGKNVVKTGWLYKHMQKEKCKVSCAKVFSKFISQKASIYSRHCKPHSLLKLVKKVEESGVFQKTFSMESANIFQTDGGI